MANYGRDKMKKDGDAAVGLGAAAALGILGAIVGGVSASNEKKKQEQARQEEIEKCNSKISDIDNEIANLRSQFLGSVLNSDRIEQLQSWRKDWVETRNKLMNS